MEKKTLIVGVEIMVDADNQDCCHGDCPYLKDAETAKLPRRK